MTKIIVSAGLIAISAALIFACGPDTGQTGLGAGTGEACYLQYCAEDFCTKDNHGDCNSLLCVGRSDQYYCSEYCNFVGDCPYGFVCSINCDVGLAESTFCLTEEDYEFLQSIGKCP